MVARHECQPDRGIYDCCIRNTIRGGRYQSNGVRYGYYGVQKTYQYANVFISIHYHKEMLMFYIHAEENRPPANQSAANSPNFGMNTKRLYGWHHHTTHNSFIPRGAANRWRSFVEMYTVVIVDNFTECVHLALIQASVCSICRLVWPINNTKSSHCVYDG